MKRVRGSKDKRHKREKGGIDIGLNEGGRGCWF